MRWMPSRQNHRKILSEAISRGREQYEICKSVWLPSLLTSVEEVACFHVSDNEPNYVTQKSVIAPVAYVDTDSEFKNQIALVKGADPGYDWIFSYKIKGLVTLYGGMASHMAIRCAEFNIPAAIGCGALLYERVNTSEKIILDCKNKKIKKII